MARRILFILFMMLFGVSIIEGAKILALFPLPGKSHMVMHSVLLKELAARGHEITVVSPFPEPKPIPNYTDIDIGLTLDSLLKEAGSSKGIEIKKFSYYQLVMLLWILGNKICDEVLQHSLVQNLINSKDKHFDLIITEGFFNDCVLGFAHKFKAPIVQTVTNAGTAYIGDWVGNPNPYSYVPDTLQEFSDRMTFYERMLNTLGNTFQKLSRDFYFLPKQQEILEKYFSDYAPLPTISELDSSTSLILVNHHFSISYPRPLMPNMVLVGGMHIKPAQKLPQDIQKFIDEAPDGVIYFSIGTALKSVDLPEYKRTAFLKAFSNLKQRVLWKWENDTLPGIPQNVKVGKWFPQSDILAHPNVRLFISHGGLLGTQESIHWGVPVVGIPFVADQKLNIGRAVLAGYAVQLDYETLTAKSLSMAIKEVLENPRYSENVKRLSRIYRDQPLTPLEQAVFWTEYVIRHKGAPHMRSAVLDLAWYQYFLLDVIAVLTLAVGSVLLLILLAVRAVLRRVFGLKSNKSEEKKSRKKND